MNCDNRFRANGTVFRFGSVDQKGLGEMNIRLPLGDNHFIIITVHIVALDVPLVLGLDATRTLKLVFEFSSGTIYSPKNDKAVFLVTKREHLYLEWPPSLFYKKTKLRKMHRFIYHSSSEKL